MRLVSVVRGMERMVGVKRVKRREEDVEERIVLIKCPRNETFLFRGETSFGERRGKVWTEILEERKNGLEGKDRLKVWTGEQTFRSTVRMESPSPHLSPGRTPQIGR